MSMDQPHSSSSNKASIFSTLIYRGPSKFTAGETHKDWISVDEQGFVNPEELTQIVSESHFVQVNSLILRFKDTDGTWARVLEGKIPVHINKSDGSLIVEVQANHVVQQGEVEIIPRDRNVPTLVLERFAQNGENVNLNEDTVRGTNDLKSSQKDRTHSIQLSQDSSNLTYDSSSLGVGQSLKKLAELSDSGSSSEEDDLALLTEVPNGKIDESWLIVERSGDVPLAPNERREERLIGGRKAFVETYQALFQAGLHWFGENEKAENHPKNSRRIFGSEGGIAITPEKLVSRIRGLALYLDDSQKVDRFVLFLASRKSSFLPEESTTVYRRKSTGSWKPRGGEKWKELSRKVPELSVLDHSWEDPPGNYWNDNWHCMVQLIVQKKDKVEDPDTICLAAIPLLSNGRINWFDPKTALEFQNMATLLRNVEKTTVCANPFLQVRFSPSNLACTREDLRNLLTYLDRLLPISLFFESSNFSKEDLSHCLPGCGISLEDFKMKLKGISRKILNTIYTAFLKEIKTPETVLSHYDSTDALEDLLSQLYRSYGITPPYGTSPQVPDFLCSPKGVPYTSEAQLPAEKFEFKIPEMPSSPRAKMLQNFQRRLMFPGYFLPHNGENFQSVRSDVLKRNLERIGCRNISLNEVGMMSWPELKEKLIRWIQQTAVLIYVLLPKERQLCEMVLSGTPQFEMYQSFGHHLQWILNIGETMASSPKHPKKIILLLQMYCLVDRSLTHTRETFRGKGETHVGEILKQFLKQMVESIKSTLEEFKDRIKDNEKLIIGGEREEIKKIWGRFRSSGSNGENNEQRRNPIRDLSDEVKGIVQESALTREVLKYLNILCSDKKGFPEILRHVFSSQGGEKSEHSFPIELQARFHCIFVTLKENLEANSTRISNDYLRITFVLNNLTYICKNGELSESLSALSKSWVDMVQVEIRKQVNDLIKHLVEKIENEVFKENLKKEKVLHALVLFNSEFESLLSNKVIRLISEDSIRIRVYSAVLSRVSEGYKNFYNSNRKHILKSKRSNFLTAEEVEQHLMEKFSSQS